MEEVENVRCEPEKGHLIAVFPGISRIFSILI